MKTVKRKATVYFASHGKCNFSLNQEFEFTTDRGAVIAFRNLIKRNLKNAAAVFGNYAPCNAFAVEDGKQIMKAAFLTGYFA